MKKYDKKILMWKNWFKKNEFYIYKRKNVRINFFIRIIIAFQPREFLFTHSWFELRFFEISLKIQRRFIFFMIEISFIIIHNIFFTFDIFLRIFYLLYIIYIQTVARKIITRKAFVYFMIFVTLFSVFKSISANTTRFFELIVSQRSIVQFFQNMIFNSMKQQNLNDNAFFFKLRNTQNHCVQRMLFKFNERRFVCNSTR